MMRTNANITPLTTRPARRTYGRSHGIAIGALEMIKVTTWTAPGGGKIRVTGRFDVFCGNGNTHRISVDETRHADDLISILSAHYGRAPYVDEAAEYAIDAYLCDEWSDPCEETA